MTSPRFVTSTDPLYYHRDALFVQCAFPTTHSMLTLTASLHSEYCERHKFDYWALIGNVKSKSDLLLEAIDQGYKYIVVSDADVLIVDHIRDLREACPYDAIGATWHENSSWGNGAYDHYNLGIVYCQVGPTIRNHIERWANTDPCGHPWGEQDTFNQMDVPKVRIGAEWNSMPGWESSTPIVKAWHGYGNNADRLAAMTAEFSEISY